jgi:hypothetical protein
LRQTGGVHFVLGQTMRIILNKFLYGFLLASLTCIAACSPRPLLYSGPKRGELYNPAQTALCLPVRNMRIEYFDNTQQRPDTQYSDTFLQEAATGLLRYEVAQRFKISASPMDSSDSIENFQHTRYSVLLGDTALRLLASRRIQSIAEKYAVNIVVVPYSISIRQRIVKPEGWRADNGPGYDRPVSFTATTNAHIQFWNGKGQLLYERIGRNDTGRPVLYSLLKREKPGRDVVKFAKKFYAPPLVKSLYASIKTALRINR